MDSGRKERNKAECTRQEEAEASARDLRAPSLEHRMKYKGDSSAWKAVLI